MENLKNLSKERDQNECKTFRPQIDKKSRIITENDKNQIRNYPVHKRLHYLNKRKCRNLVKSQLEPVHSHHKSSHFNCNKHNYLTEQLNIHSVLNESKRRCRSKDMKKRQNLHNTLYNDAFKRRESQNKMIAHEHTIIKNQSIRSFIRHNRSQPNLLSNRKPTQKVKKHELPNSGNVSQRLSKGSPDNCKSFQRLHKCGSTSMLNKRFRPNKKSQKIGDDFRKKMGHQPSTKNGNVVEWLANSHFHKEQWVKTEKDKQSEIDIKECTFKPAINKRQPTNKFILKPEDRFTELYQKARKKKSFLNKGKSKNDIEYEKQKEECTFEPKINKSKKSSPDSKAFNYRKESRQESIPEVTANCKALNQNDLEYVSSKIEQIKDHQDAYIMSLEQPWDNFEFEQRVPEDSVNSEEIIDNDSSKLSSASPEHSLKHEKVNNKLSSETPRTEELEEELRDQVHDYQNPLFDANFSSHHEMNIMETNQQMMFNNHHHMSPETNSEYIENDLGDVEDEHPLLFIDVNLGPDKAERIVVFEGDTADDLAIRFSERHNLNGVMKGKLQTLIHYELSSLGRHSSME